MNSQSVDSPVYDLHKNVPKCQAFQGRKKRTRTYRRRNKKNYSNYKFNCYKNYQRNHKISMKYPESERSKLTRCKIQDNSTKTNVQKMEDIRKNKSSRKRCTSIKDNSECNAPKRRLIGFKYIENLLEKDPEQLLVELSDSTLSTSELIKNEMKEDIIVLFIKILKKVIKASFDDTKYKVLQIYINDNFVYQLTKYITYLPMHNIVKKKQNKFFWDSPDEFWNNIVEICQYINNTLPSFSLKVLPEILKSLTVCFSSFENQHNLTINEKIKTDIHKLNEVVQQRNKEYEKILKGNLKRETKITCEDTPPDDFRQISVYPSSLELTAGIVGFIRKNIVDGSYKDVNHYLDVQFRLLREDFVRPLRNAIKVYRLGSNAALNKQRIKNIRIYQKIHFLNVETLNEHFCFRLRFDFSGRRRKIQYNSKKFMYGSLLCFTSDDFKNIIFGKVAERKIEDLEKGELIVSLDENIAIDYNTDYLMVESEIYFEPYYHVLNVLKTMNVENFPMEKYIIKVDFSTQQPSYLKDPNYNFLTTNNHCNELQQIAFKAAITQEFCVIQGPPGTGKTFLGLKIAQTLLSERSWYKHTPMLIISYTNHALDQFLEGLTEYTRSIIRVGGQSKNDNLKKFNLRNVIKLHKNLRFYQKRNEVQTLLGNIKIITETLKEIESYQSVFDFHTLEDVIPNYESSWFAKAKKQEMLKWLMNSDEDLPSVSETTENLQSEKNVEKNDNAFGFDENNIQLDDIFEITEKQFLSENNVLISLSTVEKQIEKFQEILKDIRNMKVTHFSSKQKQKAETQLKTLKNQYENLKDKLLGGKRQEHYDISPELTRLLSTPQTIPSDERWKLYFHWLNLYKRSLIQKREASNVRFRAAYRSYEEIRDIEHANVMKKVLVVGMTTTGAARLRSSLQALKSPIVIVEEAAEVLEAHIISSLTQHCKHLILIGDHQQLKPSTANYKIEKFYNLGISLFERMVLNKIQLHTLNIQHRMRPEISSLITPSIYPELKNHSSVMNRPMIKGLDKNVYFIDHTYKEEEYYDTSRKNQHEVEFLIQLAKHLVLNGHTVESITILVAYSGQLFEMQKEKKKYKHILGDIRIAVLDNYQGEESDIILLSLVRNNKQNEVGFLKIDNRVCVALSRARNGLYVMGNITQLCNASELWSKIRITLEQQNAIGSKLPLRCQIHPDKLTYVEKSEDFLHIPEGGCSQKCRAKLTCGHYCTALCHILNRDHNEYKCMEPCRKACGADPQHICQQLCYEKCNPCAYKVLRSLVCGHKASLECHLDPSSYNCTKLVSTTLPCGHKVKKPCHRDPQTYRCPRPCEIMVEPCGHSCAMLCHAQKDPDHLEYKCEKPCAKYGMGCTVQLKTHLCRKLCYEECDPCSILVWKERTICTHVHKVECSYNIDELICKEPCVKTLTCGHKCTGKCYENCGKCEKVVEKTSPCGHVISVKCFEEPQQKFCLEKCSLKLSCGHNCTNNCNESCTTRCKKIVDCALNAVCGHIITKIPCWVANSDIYREDPKKLLKYCNNPCSAQLECEHTCSGTCRECYQGRIHKRCNQKCGFPLICNHPCEFPCRKACRPCSRRCEYKCKHSSCGKKCGEICTSCREICTRSCKHQKCNRFCGEICDVPPCEQPCEKKLKCGHPCVGFCGDPCPPKCLICDKEELTTIFFRMEDEEGARFVMLNDCGHIFESKGMKEWMDQNDNQISIKVCPNCKTSIRTTHRYSDFVKKSMEDVANAKRFSQGNEEVITKQINDLKEKVLLLKTKLSSSSLIRGCPKIEKVLQMLSTRLESVRCGRRQSVNKFELNAIEAKLQVIEHILEICNNATIRNTKNEIFHPQIDLIMDTLLRGEDCLSNQEVTDIQLELTRLIRIVDYAKIRYLCQFQTKLETNNETKELVNSIEKLLFGLGKFIDEHETNVEELLQKLNKIVGAGIGISETERKEIVKAMGFKQGHWYKCPNGHPYVIADCGGAMVESVCPECKARIGGSHHRLRSDNAVATEMDGARHSAWSEAANMGNYQFNF